MAPAVQIIDHDILSLHLSLATYCHGWVDITTEPVDSIHLCKVSEVATQSSQPPVITHSLSVNSNRAWALHVHNHPLSAQALLNQVDNLNICCGQPDSHFVSMVQRKKGKIISAQGQAKAYIDEYAPVTLGVDTYQATIRTTSCELLTSGNKCSKCKRYRNTLRRSACDMSSPTSHSNERYLNTPQRKLKLSKVKKRLAAANKQISKLEAKIKEFTQRLGDCLDPSLHSGLVSVMADSASKDIVNNMYPEGTFANIFWEQQFKAASAKDCRQVRWHPNFV